MALVLFIAASTIFLLFALLSEQEYVLAQEILTPSRRLSCTGDRVCSYATDQDLDFFVIGDTGGLPVYPYVTYAQKQVANAMARLANNERLKFVVNVGDNFYFNGVEDVFDSRFEDSFEEVYGDERLRVPWFTIAGNHDHLGNVTAQIQYTQHSSRWTFPSLYYKIGYQFGGQNGDPTTSTVDIIFIDTIVLCGNTIDVQGSSIWNWMFHKSRTPKGPDPQYVEEAKVQWQWIQRQISTSTAKYLIVVGHYPVYSISEHGSIQCLIDQLDPLLRQYNVTAYFSGHDHNLQHIKLPKGTTNGMQQDMLTTQNYFVSGAGSRSDRSTKHLQDVPSDALLHAYPSGWNPFSQLGFSNGGFLHVELRSTNATVNFYNGKMERKYATQLQPRVMN